MLKRLVILSSIIAWAFLLVGCGGAPRPTEDPQRVARAEEMIADLERTFSALHDLPPRERRERYLALRPRLEEAVRITDDLPVGSRIAASRDGENTLSSAGSLRVSYNYHAKALYWLANWRFLYDQAQGVDELLDQLDRQLSQVLQNSGRTLRVQVRLRQGRVAEAREMAEALARRMPEAAGMLDVVTWFEQVGRTAPHLDARNLGGGASDPWAADGRWILVLFTPNTSPESAFYLERMRAALASLPAARRPRLVQVSFDGSPLQAAKMGAAGEDLLWTNPNLPGEATRWRTAWKLPEPLPRSALLGPDRTILAVETTPEQLAELVK